MSLLPKIEAGLRGVQMLITLLVTVFWGWMRTQGFLQLWATAPPGAYTYGTILFALGIIAGIWGLFSAVGHLAFISRARSATIGRGIQGARAGADILALGLFVSMRVMINVTPSQFLPDLLEPSNAATAKEFFAIQEVTSVGIAIAIFLFALSFILIIVQIFWVRRQRPLSFDKLEENPATGGPYSQQSFSRPAFLGNSNSSREPLAMYGEPPATSNNGLQTQAQVYGNAQGGFGQQSLGGVGYATSTYGQQNGSGYSSSQSQNTAPPRTTSVFSAAPLSAIGQAYGHQRGGSSVSQHQRGPSGNQNYHQRQQSSHSSQRPQSPWAGQTAYGGTSYQGQPQTPGSKPLPAQPQNQRDTMQQAYQAHQQQTSSNSAAYQPGHAPVGYVPQGNRF